MPATTPAKTILHALQNEHTSLDGGWFTSLQVARAQGLTPEVVGDALLELNRAGMIETRFNPALMCEEVRSRGVTAFHGDHSEPDLLAAPHVEDDAVVEEHMARRVLTFLLEAIPGEWYRDADLLRALHTDDLGAVWSGLNLLEAAGLIQRRLNNGRAVRAHLDLARAIR
jgi:hypothetical protein